MGGAHPEVGVPCRIVARSMPRIWRLRPLHAPCRSCAGTPGQQIRREAIVANISSRPGSSRKRHADVQELREAGADLRLIHPAIPIASPERPMAGMRAGYNMAKKSSHGVAPKVSVVECP